MSDMNKELLNAEEAATEKVSKNFIEQIIDKDLAEGVYDTVHTRCISGGNRDDNNRICNDGF